jgi:hypothetical protein
MKSTSYTITELDELLMISPGMSLDTAREILFVRLRDANARDKAERERFQFSSKLSPADMKPTESLVFPKRANRITSSDADHLLRISSKKNDDKAMRAFLKNGGTITVLPTRDSRGFKKSRISTSTPTVAGRSDKAHSQQAHTARHNSIVASIAKHESKNRS